MCDLDPTARQGGARGAHTHHCFEDGVEKSTGDNAVGAPLRFVRSWPVGEVGLATLSDLPSSSVVAKVVFLLISSFGRAETQGEGFDFRPLLLERRGIFTTSFCL